MQNQTQNKIYVKVRISVPNTVEMNITVNEIADCRLAGAVILLSMDVQYTSNRSKCYQQINHASLLGETNTFLLFNGASVLTKRGSLQNRDLRNSF